MWEGFRPWHRLEGVVVAAVLKVVAVFVVHLLHGRAKANEGDKQMKKWYGSKGRERLDDSCPYHACVLFRTSHDVHSRRGGNGPAIEGSPSVSNSDHHCIFYHP